MSERATTVPTTIQYGHMQNDMISCSDRPIIDTFALRYLDVSILSRHCHEIEIGSAHYVYFHPISHFGLAQLESTLN